MYCGCKFNQVSYIVDTTLVHMRANHILLTFAAFFSFLKFIDYVHLFLFHKEFDNGSCTFQNKYNKENNKFIEKKIPNPIQQYPKKSHHQAGCRGSDALMVTQLLLPEFFAFLVFLNSFPVTYLQFLSIKCFHKILLLYNAFTKSDFCESLRISLSTDKIVDRGKVAYIWISSDPSKARLILEVIVVVTDGFVSIDPKFKDSNNRAN